MIDKNKTIYSIPIEPSLPNNRINDADVDLNGQIWISTMDIQQKSQTGKVICHDTNLKPIYSDNSYIISNGPVFDYERNVGYVTDSIKRIIYIFSIIPGIIFLENGLFCRYYFFSLLFFYIYFYKKLYENFK